VSSSLGSVRLCVPLYVCNSKVKGSVKTVEPLEVRECTVKTFKPTQLKECPGVHVGGVPDKLKREEISKFP